MIQTGGAKELIQRLKELQEISEREYEDWADVGIYLHTNIQEIIDEFEGKE